MINIHIARNSFWQTVFDPVSSAFVHQTIQHPFFAMRDSHARRMIEDVGVDADAVAVGRLTLISNDGLE